MNSWRAIRSRLSRGAGRWWIVLGLALAAALVHSQAGTVQLPWTEDSTWARIQRDGIMRVGLDASYPPFEDLTTEGEFVGLDIDLARALASRWGVDVIFLNVHLDGLYDALAAGKFDLIISALPYDRTMTRDVRYSHSYFNAGQVLVGPSGVVVDDIRDTDGWVVAVELGSQGHQLARQLARDGKADLRVHTERQIEDAVELVVQGKADALLCDRVSAHGIVRQWEALAVVGPELTDEPMVMAVPIGSHELHARINQALVEWSEDGTLDALRSRWL